MDVVISTMITATRDFELPGPLLLAWRCTWHSDSELVGHLSYGSRLNLGMGLEMFEGRQICVYLADSRAAEFNKEEKYTFERDLKGNIIKETGFDNVTRVYKRGLTGEVLEITRPGDRWAKYKHDAMGNVIRVDYHDRTWDTFKRDKNGELIEAANQHRRIRFQRDKLGRVVKEWQDNRWVASEYDHLGNRIQISSDLGAKIAVERDAMGQVTRVEAAHNNRAPWIANMGHNQLGQEVERTLPGGVTSHWRYDNTGKPIHHQTRSNQEDTRRRKYGWGINDQLKSITDELGGSGTAYGYDQYSALVWSRAEGKAQQYLYREADELGNIYETEDKTDRIYGAGSRLEKSKVNTNELRTPLQGGQGKLVTKGTDFVYDEEGNLIQKTEANGDTWRYEYNGNGTLSKVIRPDNTEVILKHDALGRRFEKTTAGKTKKYLWDGDNPLHE